MKKWATMKNIIAGDLSWKILSWKIVEIMQLSETFFKIEKFGWKTRAVLGFGAPQVDSDEFTSGSFFAKKNQQKWKNTSSTKFFFRNNMQHNAQSTILNCTPLFVLMWNYLQTYLY